MDAINQATDMIKDTVNKLLNEEEAIIEKITNTNHLVIKQGDDCCFNYLCLFTPENIYHFYPSDHKFQVAPGQKSIAQFQESSSYISRCCLKQARGFQGQIKVGESTAEQGKRDDLPHAANLYAPYKCHNPIPLCSCFCNKPEIRVTNLKDEHIGRVTMPCWCPMSGWGKCDIMELRILDRDDNLVYMIQQTCCQKPVMCMPFQCAGCETIEYVIKDTSKKQVGKIVNLHAGVFQECCSKADNFGIEFPDNAEPHKKLLLIMATLWIDYLQYLA